MDSETELKYKTIVQSCSEGNQKFQDGKFPASFMSIGVNKKHSVKITRSLKWLRPLEIKTKEEGLEWTVFRDIKPTDICQGTLGNCWFISALAVVASEPELIQRLILTSEINPAGVYLLRLCKDGVWTTVIVDDRFPCDGSNRLTFARAKEKQLWVSLLEKAMAKLYGSYLSLQAGQAMEGLVSLTGFPCQTIDFKDIQDEKTELDIIWQTLFSCSKAKFLMGICCGGYPEIPEEEYERVGLVSEHAYSILEVRSIQGLRLLRLRNPWGKHSWKGDWNMNSGLWTPELLAKIQPKVVDDGTFWISFTDTRKYFSRVDICQLRSSWQENRFQGTFSNSESLTAPAYIIHVTKPTEFELALYQPSERSLSSSEDRDFEDSIYVDISMILVLLDGEPGEWKIKRYLGGAPRQFTSCSIAKLRESIIQPGAYALLPFSIRSLCSHDKNQFAISIHSSSEVQVSFQESPSSFLTDSLGEFATKSGVRKEYNEYVHMYVKSHWAGLLLMTENRHPERSLKISCNLSASKNMTCSRKAQGESGMETWDVVPPKHRQILAILTREKRYLESLTSYVVRYTHSRENRLGEFGPLGSELEGHFPGTFSSLHEPRPKQ